MATEAHRRAFEKNLEKGRLVVSKKRLKRDLKNIDKGVKAIKKKLDKEMPKEINAAIKELKKTVEEDLPKELEAVIDQEVKDLVAKRLEVIDRKTLKNEFLRVFNDLGGAVGLTNWAKDSKANQREFYKMFVAMVKGEAEGPKGGGGVKVNMFFGDSKEPTTIEMQPVKREIEEGV